MPSCALAMTHVLMVNCWYKPTVTVLYSNLQLRGPAKLRLDQCPLVTWIGVNDDFDFWDGLLKINMVIGLMQPPMMVEMNFWVEKY